MLVRLLSHYRTPPGFDAKSGAIFCAECGDFVYHSEAASAQDAAALAFEESRTFYQGLVIHDFTTKQTSSFL